MATATEKAAQDRFFEDIWRQAYAAGVAAGNAHTPQPMVVSQRANVLDDQSPVTQSWHVPDGVCGFAWVHFKGNTPFGRWAKRTMHARADYPNGLAYWVSDHGQSYERKAKHARAFADVLQEIAGIDCYAQSRLD